LNTIAQTAECSTSTLIIFSTVSRRCNALRRGSCGSAVAAVSRRCLLVLGFAAYDEVEIAEGLQKLARIWG